MWHEIFSGVQFYRLAIFVFVFAGTNFCVFQKVPSSSFDKFSFLLSTCNRNTYFQTINQYFNVYFFVSE